MPTPFSYTLTGGGGGVTPPTPIPVTPGVPTIPCLLTQMTQDDFLALFARILPDHYIVPLQSPGPGYELLQMFAKLGERASLALTRAGCQLFILRADGGVKATGTAQFFRDGVNPYGETIYIKAGTRVATSSGGREFVTTEDSVSIGPSAIGPWNLAIEAVAPGYEYNVSGQVTTADGTVLPGEIDTITLSQFVLPTGVLTIDESIMVRQLTATSGGVPAVLDAHGADRGLPRSLGESDISYKARIRSLVDTVSPDAIVRHLDAAMLPYGATADFIETFEVGYVTCWDAPSSAIPDSDYDPNLFAYDDPRMTPFHGRWLDEYEARGAFIVVVPALPSISQTSMAFDDTAADVAAHHTAIGLRAHSAFDVPADALAAILQGAFDGFDLGVQSAYKALWDLLQQVKPAGIAAIMELEGN